MECFECEFGHYVTKKAVYVATLFDGQQVRVPDVPHEICNRCGDVCFTFAASVMIEDAISEHREKVGGGL